MKNRIATVSAAIVASLSLAACADNYAVEGGLAGAAAGAGIGALSGGDAATGAAIGAAAGAAGGSLIRKDGKCYRVDSQGREHRVDCN